MEIRGDHQNNEDVVV